MAQRVVFLGAGTGGTMAANRLAKLMADDVAKGKVEIVLISGSQNHYYQPGLLYVALDQARPEDFQRSQEPLLQPGVRLLVNEAKRIVPEERAVELSDGSSLAYDYLVIATGSVPDLDAIPGFREGAYSFYTLPEALRLRDQLRTFERGRVLLIIGVPHKCPVAPLEFFFMLDDLWRKRGKREDIELMYTYPIARLHSLVPISEWAEKEFARRKIRGETFFNVERIDAKNRTVSTLEGEEVEYDLLVGIPPHKGASVIRESGLGDREGWLPTDAKTLRMKGQDRIYVLGDATDLPISKAGSTAHYQSEIVARNLQHELHGEPPTALYDGKVYCFIEAGLEKATHISFDYQTPPRPMPPTFLTHLFKMAFNEMYWLSLRGLL